MLHQIIAGYLERISGIVRDGQRGGRIRRDLDPAAVSLAFLGLIQPAVLLWHLSDMNYDVARHAELSWKIFSESIAARPRVKGGLR